MGDSRAKGKRHVKKRILLMNISIGGPSMRDDVKAPLSHTHLLDGRILDHALVGISSAFLPVYLVTGDDYSRNPVAALPLYIST